MTTANFQVLKLNKRKLIVNLLLLSAGVLITVIMISQPEKFVSTLFRNQKLILIFGILGLIYFSLILISRFILLIKGKEAIRVSDEFFIDNSSYESIGEISWKNISEIEMKKTFMGTKYIVIHTKSDFLKYKFENLNLFKKALIIMKNWDYKSTVIINSNFVGADFTELHKSLIKRLLENHEN